MGLGFRTISSRGTEPASTMHSLDREGALRQRYTHATNGNVMMHRGERRSRRSPFFGSRGAGAGTGVPDTLIETQLSIYTVGEICICGICAKKPFHGFRFTCIDRIDLYR